MKSEQKTFFDSIETNPSTLPAGPVEPEELSDEHIRELSEQRQQDIHACRKCGKLSQLSVLAEMRLPIGNMLIDRRWLDLCTDCEEWLWEK